MVRFSHPSGRALLAPSLPRFAALLAASSLLALAPMARAAWNASGENVPSQHCSPFVTACSDAEGGLLTFWTEDRGAGFRLFAHRRLADGNTAAGWPESGRDVAPASQFSPTITAVSDGAGGAFVLTCATFLSYPDKRLFLWHLDADGARDPSWPDSGLALQGGGHNKAGSLVADGTGGVFVAWFEYLDEEWRGSGIYARYELRITRVLSIGLVARGWSRSGMVLSQPVAGGTKSLLHANPVLEPDGLGGVFVANADSSDGHFDGRLYRVGPRGTRPAGWPAAGVVLGATERDIPIQDLALDGAGGVFVLAGEGAPFQSNTRLARIDAAGLPASGWPDDGRVLFPGVGDWRLPIGLVSDGVGGAIIATTEVAGTHVTQRFIRLNGSGDPAAGWDAGGVAIADDQALGMNWTLADDAGGLCLVFGRFRMEQPHSQVVARRIQGDGSFPAGWTADGRVMVDWHDNSSGSVALDGTRAIYFVHASGCPVLAYRTGDDARPAARAVLPFTAAVASTGISELRVSPNPARGAVELRLRVAQPGPVAIEVLDLSGRVLRSFATAFATGEHVVRWDGNDAQGHVAPPGLYFVRARDASGFTQARVVRIR